MYSCMPACMHEIHDPGKCLNQMRAHTHTCTHTGTHARTGAEQKVFYSFACGEWLDKANGTNERELSVSALPIEQYILVMITNMK